MYSGMQGGLKDQYPNQTYQVCRSLTTCVQFGYSQVSKMDLGQIKFEFSTLQNLQSKLALTNLHFHCKMQIFSCWEYSNNAINCWFGDIILNPTGTGGELKYTKPEKQVPSRVVTKPFYWLPLHISPTVTWLIVNWHLI